MSNENIIVEETVVEEVEAMDFENDETDNTIPVIAATAGITTAIIGVGALGYKRLVKPGIAKVKGMLADHYAKKEVVIVTEKADEATDVKDENENN